MSTTPTKSVLTSHGVTIAFDHPVPSVPAQEWACAGSDPELFFPADDDALVAAVAVCTACPLRSTCLSLATARSESGVWGGVLLESGRPLDRVPVRGRPSKKPARAAA